MALTTETRTIASVLQDIVNDGYLSETNAHRARSALSAHTKSPGEITPTLMRQAVASVVSRVGDNLRVGWLRPERVDVGTLLYCANDTTTAAAAVTLTEE